MTSPLAVLLAHQGGWDEILMVAAPLLVVGALLVLANRRAKQQLVVDTGDTSGAEHPGPSDHPGRPGA